MADLFGHDLAQITLERQIACAERELKQREFVYPRRVAAGKMSDRQARDEIAVQRAIIATLKGLADA